MRMSLYCCFSELRAGSLRGKSLGLIGGGEVVINWIGYFGDRVAGERMKGE